MIKKDTVSVRKGSWNLLRVYISIYKNICVQYCIYESDNSVCLTKRALYDMDTYVCTKRQTHTQINLTARKSRLSDNMRDIRGGVPYG